MKNLSIHNAENKEMTAEKLGIYVIDVLSEAIKQRDEALLVVSGGSTPKPLFQYLAKQPIAWNKVTVILADERCVDADDPASNAGMVKQELLTGFAAQAHFISLYEGGDAHRDDQIAAGLKLLGLPRYDMVILGMGDDGHTASIFPESSHRDAALDLSNLRPALLIDPVTVTPLRITQSAARLMNTAHLVIHFTGSGKADLFNQIVHQPDQTKWPVSAFINQTEVPLEVFTDAQILEGVAA